MNDWTDETGTGYFDMLRGCVASQYKFICLANLKYTVSVPLLVKHFRS